MHNLTARDLHQKFLDGTFSATAITEHFLKRIDQYDPQVGAFLVVFHERALKKAEELDAKRAAGQPLGALAGVPVAIKDNLHIEGELTTCASRFLANYRAPFSSTVVRLLEEADAILIGKTNLDEFAMGSSTETSAFHPTRNPWNLDCIPGGSSGGSAAAVAARLCPVALGTDTGGSVRQPAALCGITGMKTTYGRVSRHGLVAFGSSLDQVGPFASNAGDVAWVLDIIGRHCTHDSTSLPNPIHSFQEHLGESVEGGTIGVPWTLLEGLDDEVRQNFETSLEVLKGLGCRVVDVDLEILKYSVAVYYIVATAEASTNLARFDGIRYGVRSPEAKTLDEVYDFSRHDGFADEVKRRILLGTFVLSSGYQDAYYKKAQMIRTLFIQKYREAFNKCEVVAVPTSPHTAYGLGEVTDPLKKYLADIYTNSANLAGLPGISVPSGFDGQGKPFGLQFLGPQQADSQILGYADAFERAAPFCQEIPTAFK